MQPSFRLPACPACSTLSTVERPYWRRARHQSAKTKRETFVLSGCSHAAEVSTRGHFYDDADLIALVEEAWARRADQLFELKVTGWTAKARDDFRRNLEDRHDLPGTTSRLEF